MKDRADSDTRRESRCSHTAPIEREVDVAGVTLFVSCTVVQCDDGYIREVRDMVVHTNKGDRLPSALLAGYLEAVIATDEAVIEEAAMYAPTLTELQLEYAERRYDAGRA